MTAGTCPDFGANRKNARITIISPWPRPKYRKVVWKPESLIIAWIGATVSAEACRRNTSCKTALVGKPLQGVADTGAIDAAGADARDDHTEIEAVQGCRFAVDRPTLNGFYFGMIIAK